MRKVNAKNRREGGAFLALPVNVLNHKNFTSLSGSGLKLLMDFCSQLRFKEGGVINNGDLCAAWSLMEKRGWKSRDTLWHAINELLHYGWVVQTRQGGRKAPTLYAVTFFAIDECGGKLDIPATTTSTGNWKREVERWVKPKRKPAEKSVRKLDRVTRIASPCNTHSELKRHQSPQKVTKTLFMTRIASG